MILKLYLISIIFSLGTKTIYELFIIKKITISGYKFIFFKKELKKSCRRLTFSFIPFINILICIKEIFNILSIDTYIKNKLLIIEMNENDKKLVNKNLSIFNIIKINFENKIYPDSIFIFFENGVENIIYYTIHNSKIIIISSSGNISRKKLDIQVDILKKELYHINAPYNNEILLSDNLYNNKNKFFYMNKEISHIN